MATQVKWLGVLALGLSMLAQAAPWQPVATPQTRIAQGVRQGQLTRPEALRLRQEHRQLHHEARVFRADGHLSPWERAQLRHDRRHFQHDIYRARHNARWRG